MIFSGSDLSPLCSTVTKISVSSSRWVSIYELIIHNKSDLEYHVSIDLSESESTTDVSISTNWGTNHEKDWIVLSVDVASELFCILPVGISDSERRSIIGSISGKSMETLSAEESL